MLCTGSEQADASSLDREDIAVCSAAEGVFKGAGRVNSSSYGGSVEKTTLAHNWLNRMLDAPGFKGDGSKISPTQAYSTAHTGEVKGTFELAHPPQKVSDSPLQVTYPSGIADSYRGVVSGVSTHTGNDYEVRAYLMVDIEYHQSEVAAATVDESGHWTLDLSPTPSSRQGSWRFRLYQKSTNQQVGLSWPRTETYQNIVVEAYSVSDIEYLQHSQAARADNTWSFPSMGLGDKVFRIVDTSSGRTVLAEYKPAIRTGLIRSYEYLPGQDGYGTSREYNSYVYDQALALLVALGQRDKALADELLQGLIATQESEGVAAGAFRSYTDQRNVRTGSQDFYVGSNSFVAYALLKYFQMYGDEHDVRVVIARVLDFIERHKTNSGDAAGLYRGGIVLREGELRSIAWHSTEHNTDLWHVFELAGRVFDDAYLDKANRLAATIVDKLWNEKNRRFDQGFGDENKALDTASWGAIFLAAIGDYKKASQALAATESYRVERGETAGYTIYDNPSSRPTIWLEGTFGVGLAQRYLLYPSQAGFNQTIAATQSLQSDVGAWQYALDYDAQEERTDAYSVASTAWYLLATEYPGVMWSECRVPEKIPPPTDGEAGHGDAGLIDDGKAPIAEDDSPPDKAPRRSHATNERQSVVAPTTDYGGSKLDQIAKKHEVSVETPENPRQPTSSSDPQHQYERTDDADVPHDKKKTGPWLDWNKAWRWGVSLTLGAVLVTAIGVMYRRSQQ